jgi:hypothetical protein
MEIIILNYMERNLDNIADYFGEFVAMYDGPVDTWYRRQM